MKKSTSTLIYSIIFIVLFLSVFLMIKYWHCISPYSNEATFIIGNLSSVATMFAAIIAALTYKDSVEDKKQKSSFSTVVKEIENKPEEFIAKVDITNRSNYNTAYYLKGFKLYNKSKLPEIYKLNPLDNMDNAVEIVNQSNLNNPIVAKSHEPITIAELHIYKNKYNITHYKYIQLIVLNANSGYFNIPIPTKLFE